MNGKTVTVTRNEIMTALNKPDDFWLPIVHVDGESAEAPNYVSRAFGRELDFGVTSVTYNLDQLVSR